MGMFDWVVCNDTCSCGGRMTFQTKSGPKTLSYLKPGEVDEFTGYCNTCDNSYTYTRKVLDYKITKKKDK
jgi:hypothetical protein